MSDLELINLIFIYLYQKGGCDNIEIVIKDNFGIEIDSDEIFKLLKRFFPPVLSKNTVIHTVVIGIYLSMKMAIK
jgi:hypothetical protein